MLYDADLKIDKMGIKKTKKLNDLRSCLGLLKGDTEYDKIMKEVRKGWAKWTREYKRDKD